MRKLQSMTVAALVCLCGCGDSEAPQGLSAGRSPAMRLARLAHTQTRLPDGRVLIAGGLRNVKELLPPVNTDIEIFDPKRGDFRVVARMETVRGMHTATLLADGRVVFIGGTAGTGVDIFNPGTGRLEPGGKVLGTRGLHTATLLADGRILLVGGMRHALTYYDGGFHRESLCLKSIEVYDPRTRSSRLLRATLRVPRRGHTTSLLADGRVLIIGGAWTKRTEIIDTAAGTVAWGPALGIAREDHSATRLADGRLLVAGGTATDGKSLDIAEIFDPKRNSFRTLAARMSRCREDHTADLLPDGRVLITGGEDNAAGPDGRDVVLDDVELFDPKTESFVKLAPLSVPRDDHCSTVLSDGVVLITGGEDKDDAGLRSAEFVVVPNRWLEDR